MDRLNFGFRELKLAGDDDTAGARTFTGYGAVFNNVDAYGDSIANGAFKKTLREAKKSKQWPAMLLQHGGYFEASGMMPVGVWLNMEEDETGLLVEGKLAATPRAEEAYQLLKMSPRPAINGLSIGFYARKFTMGTKADEPRRILEEIELIEVSLVTFPANSQARIEAVKSFNPRDLEEALRDAGLSRSDAVKAVAIFKSMHPRDAGDPISTPRDEDVSGELVDLLRKATAAINPQS